VGKANRAAGCAARLRTRAFCWLFSLLVWLALPHLAQAYIIINAPMTDTNSSGWVLGGNPASAQLTGNGTIDPVGSGWLRLTNNSGNQTGFAYNNTTFDLSAGVLIQFDYATWGGNGADGYSIFLFDAGVPSFNIGAFGGSLGYAQKLPPAVTTAVPGISGGYVGIGVDEYGNFSNPTEGRYLGPGQTPNTVTVRGSVVGFGGGAVGQTSGTTSYPWIATSANSGSLWYNGAARPDQTSANYRKVIIQITPAPNPVANVWVQFGYNTSPVQMISNQALPSISASQLLQVGYAASTGGSNNYHEIRNLLITTLNENTSIDLGVTNTAVATGTSTAITSALVGGSFQYQLVARNFGPNNITATGVGITDNFPSTLTPGAWTCTSSGGASCGAASGSGNLNTTANLPYNGSVTYTVNVTANAMPVGNTLTDTVSLTIPGAVIDYYPNDNSASSSISVYGLPTVTKSFSPSTMLSTGTSTMNITMTNPNNVAATGVAFTDTYPSTTLKNNAAATTPQCGGTVTGSSGGSSLALSGGTIPANGSCTVSVVVKDTTTGSYTNSTGTVTTTNIGNGASASGTLVVMAKPTVAKSFTPNQVGVGLSSQLAVTITNPNAADISGAAFTDSYPTGLVNTATPAGTISGTGCSGTVTAAAGGNSLALSGGTIPANGSCTITASVAAATAGTYNNTTPAVTTTNSGSTTAGSNVSLTVLNPPTITKAFAAPGTILPGGSSVLTVTLTNPNATAITGASFSDTYPAGLFNTSALNDATTCTGGAVSNSTNGTSSGTLTLAGATIPGNGSCNVTVTTTAPAAGSFTNATGAVTTTNAGTGASASGTLVAMAPPTVSKSFSPVSVNVGSTSVLSIQLTNPNSVAVSGVAFTDTYPTNMKNTTTPAGAITGSAGCSGTVTAASGGGSVKLASGVIPANGSCTVSVNTTISVSGSYTNTIAAGGVTTSNAGSNSAAVSANLNGPQPPTLTEAFGAGSIASGGNTSLALTIGNTNGVAITLSSTFTNALPAGMTIGTAGNSGTCTGVTATAGANSYTMANGSSIPVGGCTIVVNVTSSTAGSALDTVNAGSLQTSMGNNQSAASATLNVYAPLTVTKSFSPASVSYGGSSTMTITVGNPAANPGNLTGVSISDSYTGTLANAAAGSIACSGAGSATLSGGTSGGAAVGFGSGTIVPGGTCTITQSVTATSTNNNTTGAPSATGPATVGGSAGSATLTVNPIAPTVAEAFGVSNLASGGSTTLTLTIGNGNTGAIALTSALTDTLPTGMTIGTTGNSGTCAGVTATAGAGSFSMASGASIPAGGCTVVVNVTSSTAGVATETINAGDLQTGAGSNTATSASLNIYAPPSVAKVFSPASIPSGGTSTMTITVTNPAANPGNLTGVSISDSYTGTLTDAAAGSVTCSGAGSATLTGGANGGTSVGFSAGTIVPGGTCTIIQSVTSTTASITNTTGAPAATGPVALTGGAGSAPLATSQLSPPAVAVSFSPTQVEVSPGQSTLTITLTNPSQNTVDIVGAGFSNTFPSGLTVASVVSTNCGGSTGVLTGNSGISLSGGRIPANGSCYVSVSVSSTSTGSYTDNVAIGAVTSTNAASNTAAASAKLTVATVAPPGVAITFNQNQIGVNGSSLLTISIANNNNSVALSGVNFTDSLPSGISVATPSGLNTSGCGATVTVGSGSITLTGGSIAANSTCTIMVNVIGSTAGGYTNSVSVSTTNAGTGNSSATLNVLQAPTVTLLFNPNLTTVNNSSTLSYSLYNPNSIAITGAAFTDSYPTSLVNVSAASSACSGVSSVCTCQAGTVTTANGGGGSLALSGGTIPGNATCTVTVNVQSGTAGSYYNVSGGGNVSVTTTNAGTASAAAVTLIVSSQPTVNVLKTASSPSGKPGDLITYTVTVTNPSSGYASNVVLTDTLNPAYSYLGYTSFQFADGSPSSGLTKGQMVFDDGSKTWLYTAGSDKNAPANYDGVAAKWQLPMNGTMNPNSSFTITYSIMIK